MNLKSTKLLDAKNASTDFSFAVRLTPAQCTVEARKVGASELLAGVTVSREEKPELSAAVEAGVHALAGYLARAITADLEG